MTAPVPGRRTLPSLAMPLLQIKCRKLSPQSPDRLFEAVRCVGCHVELHPPRPFRRVHDVDYTGRNPSPAPRFRPLCSTKYLGMYKAVHTKIGIVGEGSQRGKWLASHPDYNTDQVVLPHSTCILSSYLLQSNNPS